MSGIDVEQEWKLLIGGEHISTASHYEIIDPNTTKLIGRAPEATVEQALQAAGDMPDDRKIVVGLGTEHAEGSG